MNIEAMVSLALNKGASDLHVEAGLPATFRIRGKLQMEGPPIQGATLLSAAKSLVGRENWGRFLEQKSHDFSKTISGVRCRFNLLQTSRGVGMAVRLLMPFQANLERLNLHPDLQEIIKHEHGLVVLTGSTGSGKSSTIAALIQEINSSRAKHIITIENPIEYYIKPQQSFIRQREVGRDTPSFEQALIDSLREDPDVLVVGEMREPATIRLTLNAAETGHLVITTMHSGSVSEALSRIVAAFPPETQGGICAQLADSLVAIVCQKLIYVEEIKNRVPLCEILFTSSAAKGTIRKGEFQRLESVLQTGGSDKMWTFQRYKSWLDSRSSWFVAADHPLVPDTEEFDASSTDIGQPIQSPIREAVITPYSSKPKRSPLSSEHQDNHEEILEIDDEDDLENVLHQLKKKKPNT